MFEKCALRHVEGVVEDWVDKYCEKEDPNFQDIHQDTIKKALLKGFKIIF